MPPSHITVTAPEGRKTPIPPADGANPGSGMLYVDPGTVCRVKYSQETRRSIARGDLLPCTLEGTLCDLEAAACPEPLPNGDRMSAEHLAELAAAKAAAAPIAPAPIPPPSPAAEPAAATSTDPTAHKE